MSESIIRVLIADDNSEFCEVLSDAIGIEEDMMCVACAHDGEQALQAVEQWRPDVLILDHVMPKLDGIGVLEALKHAEFRPKVLMLTAFGQESLIHRASDLGADYYVMKPFDIPTLIRRIRQVADPSSQATHFAYERRRQEIEREVVRQLSDLGVPAHFKGYTYLKEAVTLVVMHPHMLSAVTKELYPTVARAHKSNAIKVERAIRHAIESTWTRGNLDCIDALFAYSVDANKGKPTNSSFIARLADQVRMDVLAS